MAETRVGNPIVGYLGEGREALTPAEEVELTQLRILLLHATAAKLIMEERLQALVAEKVRREERR